MATIEYLRAMKDGWDGPRSVAPTTLALDLFVELQGLTTHLVDAPVDLEPIPVGDGGLRAEWDRGPRSYTAAITGNGALWVCALEEVEANDWDKDCSSVAELADFYGLSVSTWFQLTAESWETLKQERATLGDGND